MASTSEGGPEGGPGHLPGGHRDLLDEHGDTQVPAGHLDLAVNVHPVPPPGLAAVLAAVDATGYPDATRARSLLADRHGVAPEQVLLVNGAAEAFWALAHATRPRPAVCVHPSFTAPEAAFRSAGHPVQRVVRSAERDFRLDPDEVPGEADVVVLGRPDNPTGRSEPLEVLRRLARPERLLVVDEAFAEYVGDGSGLTRERDVLPGLVQVRSLTKIWGLAGLRMGYVVADAGLVARLAAVLQPWPVNSYALAATEHLFGLEHGPRLDGERLRRAQEIALTRRGLSGALRRLGLQVWPSDANYLLVRCPGVDLRAALLERGVAVRRGDTFPGLDASYVRIAVHPEPDVSARLLAALAEVLGGTG